MEKNGKVIGGVALALVIFGAGYILGQQSNQSVSGEKKMLFQAPLFGKKEPDVYKIGFIAPLTGDAAVYGEPARNIAQLAVDEINKSGIKGKKIEVIYEDGKCNGKDAANAMQKLVNIDKVEVVIGGFCSGESLAAVPIATQNKVLMLSPGSSSPDLTNVSTFFFRNYPSDAAQGKVLAQVAANRNKWKKVAFIQEQLDYPLGIAKSFTAEFQALGGMVVKEEFPKETTDFRSIITKVRAQKPDGLFIDTQTPAAAERILKQLREAGWRPPLMVADSVTGDKETVRRNAVLLEGAMAAEFGVDATNEKFKNLKQAYKDRFKKDMQYESYAQTWYDAFYMIRDGIVEVGYSGDRLAGWSRTVKDWQGASGSVTIESTGDRASGHTGKIIRNGTVELLK